MVLLHHPVAKVKRQKLLNTEIKKVRRKLSMDKASQKSQKGKFSINFMVLQLHFLLLNAFKKPYEHNSKYLDSHIY